MASRRPARPARSSTRGKRGKPSPARNVAGPKGARRGPARASSKSAPGGDNGKGGKRGRGRRRRRTPLGRLREISPRPVIMIMLLAIFLAFSFGPTTRNIAATSELRKEEAELRKERELTSALDREVVEARSMGYVEMEARRQRLVLPGETLYLVTPADEGRSRIRYRVKGFQTMDEAWESVRRRMNCAHGRSAGESD